MWGAVPKTPLHIKGEVASHFFQKAVSKHLVTDDEHTLYNSSILEYASQDLKVPRDKMVA